MKVAFVGGMNIDNEELVAQVMEDAGMPFDMILTTEDEGISKNVRVIAAKKNIPYLVYAPDWNNLNPEEGKVEVKRNKETGVSFNKRAALNRNMKLVKDCDGFVMIWDGESSGCRSFLDLLKNEPTKLTYIVKVPQHK